MFTEELINAGWKELALKEAYAKGDWRVWFDTSSWLIVENKINPHIFPVHVPEDHESRWTVNLIEHLCKMEDERFRLREALELVVRANPPTTAEAAIAQEALRSCYHRWLVKSHLPESDRTIYYCAICGNQKHGAGDA